MSNSPRVPVTKTRLPTSWSCRPLVSRRQRPPASRIRTSQAPSRANQPVSSCAVPNGKHALASSAANATPNLCAPWRTTSRQPLEPGTTPPCASRPQSRPTGRSALVHGPLHARSMWPPERLRAAVQAHRGLQGHWRAGKGVRACRYRLFRAQRCLRDVSLDLRRTRSGHHRPKQAWGCTQMSGLQR